MYYWFDQAEDRGGQVEANAVSNIVKKVLTQNSFVTMLTGSGIY